MEPLNGKKTHPLSAHALDVLRGLTKNGPRPAQEINAGVVRRFLCEDLIVLTPRPSPYRTGKGNVLYAEITAQGREVVARPENRPAG